MIVLLVKHVHLQNEGGAQTKLVRERSIALNRDLPAAMTLVM